MAPQKSSDNELQKLFKEADTDGSGCLSKEELKKLLQKGNRNVTPSQIDEVFKFFDSDCGDKQISYDEFLNGLKKISEFIQGLKAFFKKYDTNNSGCLDKNELKKILCESGHKFTDAEVDEIMKRADPNGDNEISFDEFVAAFS